MKSLPVRLFHASLFGIFLGALGVSMYHGIRQRLEGPPESERVVEIDKEAPIPAATPGTPTADDLDGDGIPNVWETANSMNPNNPADADSDFDFDGLTALQEYELDLATGSQYGKPLGTYSVSTVAAPPGFATISSLQLIESAGNGVSAVYVTGRLAAETTSKRHLFTYHPATLQWTRVLPPAASPANTLLTASDVNSQGQVVGYYSSSNGFIWTPSATDPATGASEIFFLDPGSSSPTAAIPLRISDTGYLIYSLHLGGPTYAADNGQHPLSLLDNSWTDILFQDVNDYGEFIGMTHHPMTGEYVTFLAVPGMPPFFSALGISAFQGAGIHTVPDVDFDAIQWELMQGTSPETYHGTAVDGTTLLQIDFWRNEYSSFISWRCADGGVYDDVTWGVEQSQEFDSFGNPSVLNDWGEFAGSFTSDHYFSEYYWEQIDNEFVYEGVWSDEAHAQGACFFDGRYHVTDQHTSVFGISNDPQILLGSDHAECLWSDSVIAPLNKILPVGSGNPIKTKICDNGLFILQKNTTTLQTAVPSDDSDSDGMPDDWEKYYLLDPNDPSDKTADQDNDGIPNDLEFRYRSIPSTTAIPDLRPGIDTDGDGMPNVWEWKYGFNHNDASDANGDLDNDGLTNLQEFLLATAPNDSDTDDDGVADGDEARSGTDTHFSEDLDVDGMPDDWEKFISVSLLEIFPDPAHWGTKHTHLINADLDPAVSYTTDGIPAADVCTVMVNTEDSGSGDGIQFEWQEKQETFIGTHNSDSETPYSGAGTSSTAEWSRNSITTQYNDGTAFSSAALLNRLSALAWAPVSVRQTGSATYKPLFSAFPCEFEPERIGTEAPHAHANYFTSTMSDTMTSTNGRNKSFRVRLASRKPVSDPVTANWLRIKYTGLFNTAINPELIQAITPEEATIDKGAMFSTWLTVDAPLPSASQGAGDGNNQALVQVRMEQSNPDPGGGIRFCRWLDSFTGNTLDADCAEKDRDQFRIRIPTIIPNLTKIHIKVTGLDGAIIDGAWEDKTTDGDYDVSLTQENGALVSTWMLLVSDGDDDLNYNGKGANDLQNDQTLFADFGAKIEVTLPELGNFKTVFSPQKPRGTVTVDTFYLSPTGDVPLLMEGAIGRHIGKMKEIYRQIGVRVAWASIEGMAVNQAWFDAKPASSEVADYFTPSESEAARAAVRNRVVPDKHIRIGYVNATVMQNGDNPWDPIVWVNGFTAMGTDGIIVSLEPGARYVLGVTAHEVGHTLGLQHTKLPTWNRWLMKGNGMIWNDDHLDSKRFQLGDYDIIRKKIIFYVPN